MVPMRFELRKGCTVIGVLWLVFSLLFIGLGSLLIMMLQIAERDYRNYTGTVSPEYQQLVAITTIVYRACFYGVTTIAVADAVFSIMLIIGVRKEKRVLVLPWVFEQLAVTTVWVLLALSFVVMCFITSNGLTATITFLVVVVRIAVTLYCILAVYRLHEYLRCHQPPANPLRAV